MPFASVRKTPMATAQPSDAAVFPAIGGSREAARNVRLDWDSATGKATLVWDPAENEALNWWRIRFF